MSNSHNIAVFGDTHGHIRLMLQLARLWQHQQGKHLDLILQCGDLGFFPNLQNIDKATKRFAANDPEELAFAKYFRLPDDCNQSEPEQDDIIDRTINGKGQGFDALQCPIYWIHGNHEDFSELDTYFKVKYPISVDFYETLELLPNARITSFGDLSIGAIGGGPEGSRKPPTHGDDWYAVTQKAIDYFPIRELDIFLSHSGIYHNELNPYGSEHLRQVIESRQPTYHFYAHHSKPIPEINIGRTRSFWLNDVHFEKQRKGMNPFGTIAKGCMGILQWHNKEEHSFNLVDESWFHDITWSNWQTVGL